MADRKKVWSALIFNEDGGGVFKCDVIEHEGKKWLVPYWLSSPTKGWSMPARIIALGSFPHEWEEGGSFADAVVNAPVPKALLDPAIPLSEEARGFAVDRPDIKRIVPKHLQ